jgi:hypothetical protein
VKEKGVLAAKSAKGSKIEGHPEFLFLRLLSLFAAIPHPEFSCCAAPGTGMRI